MIIQRYVWCIDKAGTKRGSKLRQSPRNVQTQMFRKKINNNSKHVSSPVMLCVCAFLMMMSNFDKWIYETLPRHCKTILLITSHEEVFKRKDKKCVNYTRSHFLYLVADQYVASLLIAWHNFCWRLKTLNNFFFSIFSHNFFLAKSLPHANLIRSNNFHFMFWQMMMLRVCGYLVSRSKDLLVRKLG